MSSSASSSNTLQRDLVISLSTLAAVGAASAAWTMWQKKRRETSALTKEQVWKLRNQYFSHKLIVSYSNSNPMMVMKGQGTHLYCEDGDAYLDTRNNVCHLGHCHPAVIRAVVDQVAVLNTNTRYLHPHMVTLADRLLTRHFPPKLNKIFFCNSGSEANDLALRLARAYSGGSENTIVVQGAYHGHTLGVLEVSPYKFLKGTEYETPKQPNHRCSFSTLPSMDDNDDSPKNDYYQKIATSPGSHIWQVPAPDTYRGPHRDPTTAADEYAQYVQDACDEFTIRRGEKVRAFIMEGGLSIGGVIVPPPGYVAKVARAVRAAGGLYIADEVQTGFGRLGSTFWAWEQQGGSGVGKYGEEVHDPVTEDGIPDIVTLGKPFGNGMPLSAVVTTSEVAKAFEDLGVEYFNTFAGNPVCCAAGLAVLKTIEEENLQQKALEVGSYMKAEFERLSASDVPLIGCVRGSGLFLGLEMVRNRDTLEPATLETSLICSILRNEYHILTSIDGFHDNVFVVKPPMVFSKSDVDYFVSSFRKAVLEDLPPALTAARMSGDLRRSHTPT